MYLKAKLLISFFLFTSLFRLAAQDPQYFSYNDESGLPSNEVYCIVQDQRGFLWLGTDAGLYKFDGIHYYRYKCATQNSKSITNLILSNSGKIYGLNFQDQIFCLFNDSLYEVPHSLNKISNIAVDSNECLFITHGGGISSFGPKSNTWKHYIPPEKENNLFCRSVLINNLNEALFLSSNSFGKIKNGKASYTKISTEEMIASHFFLASIDNDAWLFSKVENTSYTINGTSVIKNKSAVLMQAIEKRKITGVKVLQNCLWITTYKGTIRYNPKQDKADVFFPEVACSDIISDREGNYWITSLQNGLLRIPSMERLVWNSSNEVIKNEKLTHITTDGKHIYFSSVNGYVWRLDPGTNELATFKTSHEADLESFDYLPEDHKLYFSTVNTIYSLSENKLRQEAFSLASIKSLEHCGNFYFIATSQGLYIQTGIVYEKVSYTWSRKTIYDSLTQTLFVASNKGLMTFKLKNDKWLPQDTVLKNTQILSIIKNRFSKNLFVLTFDGAIYAVEKGNKETLLAKLPEEVQASKIYLYKNILYVSGNKGVWYFDPEDPLKKLQQISDLISNNAQDIVLLNDHLWIASGRGLQKIPLNSDRKNVPAIVYLKNKNFSLQDVRLAYNEPLILYPEASIYNAGSNFYYLYRINDQTEWLRLPAGIEQIEIPSLPSGDFVLELKVVDHLGHDSQNTIVVKGYVKAPFWKTWWFISLVVVLFLFVSYLVYKRQLARQRKELRRQNELSIARLTAIRSQMNPHFIFNSLNSIQDLILQEKTDDSYDYVVLFSELVRNALNYSNKDYIPLPKELEFLDTYLRLEKLRFKDDFQYEINYSGTEEIDVPSLMIQPFIENALLHGLLHKEGEKKLVISFRLDKELICVIEDNGIGREQAKKISSRQGRKHESFALDAIRKRLEILNEKNGNLAGYFSFEDLFPGQEYTGTRVVIHLPYIRRY